MPALGWARSPPRRGAPRGTGSRSAYLGLSPQVHLFELREGQIGELVEAHLTKKEEEGGELYSPQAGAGGAEAGAEAAPTFEAVVAGVVLVDAPLVAHEDPQPVPVLGRPVAPPVLPRGAPVAAPRHGAAAGRPPSRPRPRAPGEPLPARLGPAPGGSGALPAASRP